MKKIVFSAVTLAIGSLGLLAIPAIAAAASTSVGGPILSTLLVVTRLNLPLQSACIQSGRLRLLLLGISIRGGRYDRCSL